MDYIGVMRAVFILIVFAIAFAAVSYAVLWLIFTCARYLGRWLLKHKVVSDFISSVRQQIHLGQTKYQRDIISLWEFFSEIIVDPLFYVYALYSLVNRFESFNAYAETYPQYNFWELLNLDMEADMNFYLIFMIIFFAWIMWKSWRRQQEVRYQKELAKRFDSIEKALIELPNSIASGIEKSQEAIVDSLNKINNKLDDLPNEIQLEMEKKE